MENYLNDFEVEHKNPSEDALRRWRKAVTIVKNPRRRFRMVADLAKRAEAERKKRSIQERIGIQLRIEKAALQFLDAGISEEQGLLDSGQSSPLSPTTVDIGESSPTMVDSGESSPTRETTTDWTLLIASLILECLGASFDQLGYALPGMVIAFMALVISTVDLFRSALKEKITWDWRSLLPISTCELATRKRSETLVSCFGFICAVWQCVQSTTGYAYSRQNKDNPIKMTLLPFIFLGCVFFIKKQEAHRSID